MTPTAVRIFALSLWQNSRLSIKIYVTFSSRPLPSLLNQSMALSPISYAIIFDERTHCVCAFLSGEESIFTRKCSRKQFYLATVNQWEKIKFQRFLHRTKNIKKRNNDFRMIQLVEDIEM